MVGRHAPYRAVAWLIRYAIAHWDSWLDGECFLNGVDLADLIVSDPIRFLSVIEAIAWRNVLSQEDQDKLNAVLHPVYSSATAPTMEEWGTSREAIAAVQAARSFWDEQDQGR